MNKEYIKEIIFFASKGKSRRLTVNEVLSHLDDEYDSNGNLIRVGYVNLIYQILKDKNHIRSYLRVCRTRIIRDLHKERPITITPFYPNQILDYLFLSVIKKPIVNSLYEYSCGNVPGKGIHYAKEYIENHIHDYKYCAKLDIHKFYPSINKQVLMDQLKERIKDNDYINLISHLLINETGLPIGNVSSQYLSNFYLLKLDYFIKQKLGIELYVRYVDDMVLLGNNKRKLHKAIDLIVIELNKLKLELNAKWQIFDIRKRGIDFLGFVFKRNKTMIRRKIFQKIIKKINKIKRKHHCSYSQAISLESMLSWFKQINTGFNLFKKIVNPTITESTLIKIIKKGKIYE